jgi:TRAP-type transport system periplasmic protein
MKKMNIIIVGVVGLLFVIPIFSGTCSAAEAFKPLTLKFANVFPENTFFSQHHKWWADEVEKRTGGRVKVQIYWVESLVKSKDMLAGIQSGFADIGLMAVLYHPSYFPLFGLVDHIYNAGQDYGAALLASLETAEKVPEVQAELEKAKIIYLGLHSSGQSLLGTKKCINSISDVKGMVVRSVAGARADYWKNLGANPVSMALPELYEALDRGTVNGLSGMNALILQSTKLYEVAKCLYMTGEGIAAAAGIAMNLEVFKKFPKDIQEMFVKLRTEYDLRFAQSLMDTESAVYREMETKYGVKIKYPSPEEQKILLEAGQKANESLLKKTESDGHTAARKVFEYYRKALKKYEDERAKRK